jgi:DNA-binding transcriptional regulator YdaS (Cro superfamily)
MTDIQTLFQRHGIVKAHLARALGITHGAVNQWRRIPAERVNDVSRITGIPRDEMRPDLFHGESLVHVHTREGRA